MEQNKENQEVQVSETEWFHDGGRCRIRIETDGDIKKEDIEVQSEYTIMGLGFGINVESNIEEK